jgi:serine/threonine-protein kinase
MGPGLILLRGDFLFEINFLANWWQCPGGTRLSTGLWSRYHLFCVPLQALRKLPVCCPEASPGSTAAAPQEVAMADTSEMDDATIVDSGPAVVHRSSDEEIPDKLGRHNILEIVGTGAMGVVYRGFDEIIERFVAIKVIRHDIVAKLGAHDTLERFKTEAKAVGRLSHPNIATIFEYGSEEGQDFIVMEFVDGDSLAAEVGNTTRPLASKIRIISQTLDALAHAHNIGVVHRDIKPANILLSALGDVKLTDFGISLIESADSEEPEAVLGTPRYMSPEQINGKAVDHRSDIFSLGSVFYELLTGNKAFSGSTTQEIIQNVLHSEPPPPHSVDHTLPQELDAIIAKSLARDPAERYQSAAHLQQAVGEFLDTPTTSHKASTVLERRLYKDGEVIFEEGSEGREAYIVDEGTVEIAKEQDGERVVLGTIGKQNLFGEMAVIEHTTRMAAAVARGDTTVMVVRDHDFLDRYEYSDPVIRSMLSSLVRNLRTASDQLAYERAKPGKTAPVNDGDPEET